MARFKPVDMSPRFLAVDLHSQVLPGTFEYALCRLIDHEFDLSDLEARFSNDECGAPAYAPSVLLKIVLLAYSRGIVSSRAMQRACLQNVLFMAVSGDAQPDHSTLAAFVSGMGDVVAQLFARVLVVCDRQGLIGRELFAIDGVKLPSNAAKARSGTREEFADEAARMEAAVAKMIERQRIADAAGLRSEASEAERGVDAWIADPQMRQRDERFADQGKHKAKPDPLHDKSGKPAKPGARFKPADFQFDEATRGRICPAGKKLYSNGSECTINGYRVMKFQGAKQDCEPCALREQCLRKPEKTIARQASFFFGRRDAGENWIEKMKARIDSPTGRQRIGQRFATVEPVFGNLRANKRLDRFTLRGKKKVDGQWKLYCLVHNIEKLAHHGYAL